MIRAGAVLVLLALCFGATAANGASLDPSFAGGGIETFEMGIPYRGMPGFSWFYGVEIAPSGQIYLAGSTKENAGSAFVLAARLGANGTLDPSFAGSGWTYNAPVDEQPLASEGARALSIDADGGMTLAGTVNERLSTAGALDSSFGPSEPQIKSSAMIRLADGELLTAGYQYTDTQREPADLYLLGPNGAGDPSFGEAGLAPIPLHSGEYAHMKAESVLQLADGDVLAAGSGSYALSGNEEGHAFAWIARLTASGAPDTSFATGGIRYIEGGTGPGAFDAAPVLLTPRAGGLAMVAAVRGAPAETSEPMVWGLTADGLPDSSFGSGGSTAVPLAPEFESAVPSAVTEDGSGRIVLASQDNQLSGKVRQPQRPTLTRLTASGTVDQSFTGPTPWLGQPETRLYALSVDPQGRIVAAGALEATPPEGRSSTQALVERILPQGNTAPGGSGVTPISARGPSPRSRLAESLKRELDHCLHATTSRALRHARVCRIGLSLASSGTVTVRWYRVLVAHTGHRRTTVRRLLASGTVKLSDAGRATLVLRLNRRGLQALAAARHPMQLLAVGTLRASHASPISASTGFLLRVGH
jgi:uncharacterized delta-60 repeat protein